MANGLLQTSPGGLLSGIRERMQRFSADPLAMASLALALQPRRRPIENTGLEAILGGMQAANRNQYFQQAASEMEAQQQARQQQAAATEAMLAQLPPAEQAMARAMGPDFLNYKMKMIEFQQKIAEQAAAEEQKKQQAQAMQNLIESGALTPEQAALAAAMGPAFLPQYAKSIFAQPSQTTLQRNLVAAGLEPGSPKYEAAALQAIQRPPVQIDMGGKPLPISETSRLQTPAGEPVPIGTTLKGAAEMGAVPIPKPPTEGQALSAGFYERMAEANSQITPEREKLLASGSEAIAAGVPGVGNYLSSPEYQAARQAQENFVTAVLRKESGAAIGRDEMTNAIRKYFPQPGDSQTVIEQKRKSRETEINSMRRNAGKALQGPTAPNFKRVPSPDELLEKYK